MTVTVCVCSTRFVTTLETLNSRPNTRLANECTEDGKEYFFDRNAEVFASVLDYYRTGELHMPMNACVNAFKNELGYWGIDGASEISVCCLERFTGGHRAKYESYFDPLQSTGRQRARVFPGSSLGERIYHSFEDPGYSGLAKIPAFLYCLSVFFVLLTVIINLTVASMTWKEKTIWYKNGTTVTQPIGGFGSEGANMLILQLVHLLAVMYIVFDFFIRFLTCPTSRVKFIFAPMNIFDWTMWPCLLVGVLDSFMPITGVTYPVVEFLSVFQIFLIIRILKFFQHTQPVKVLFLTIKSSLIDMSLYLFLMVFLTIFFACCALVCEFKDPDDHFHVGYLSVPNSMWWAIVTLTTVGYGDMIPITIMGKIMASFCAVSGITMAALLFSAIYSNFSMFLGYAKTYAHRNRSIVALGRRCARESDREMLINE